MLYCIMFIRANHYTKAALKCPPYLIRMSTLIVIHGHLKRWILYYVCSMAIIRHFRVTKMFINSDEMSLFLPKMPFLILTQIDKKFQIYLFFVCMINYLIISNSYSFWLLSVNIGRNNENLKFSTKFIKRLWARGVVLCSILAPKNFVLTQLNYVVFPVFRIRSPLLSWNRSPNLGVNWAVLPTALKENNY